MELKQSDNPLWVERYRPTKVADCILPQRFKDTFQGYVNQGVVPNLMLAGSAGTGKTTIARALCEETGSDCIIVNGSNEGRLFETLRQRVMEFASARSLTSVRKVVILDECLEENEMVRIGTVDDWRPVKLNELLRDTEYPVVSFNCHTGQVENDVGVVVSDRHDEVFEVTLDDGRQIRCNAAHPLLVRNSQGAVVERMLCDLTVGDDIITI